MEYHTAYFWQDSKRNLSSLTLQQLYYKTKRLPIVFACAGWSEQGTCVAEVGTSKQEEGSCGGTFRPAGKIVTELADWFYGGGLYRCVKRGEGGIYQVGGEIYRQLVKQHSNIPLVGILGVGRRLCIFHIGKVSVRMFNLKKGTAYSQEIRLADGDKQGIGMQYALMEPGVGVMLGTDGFWKGISEVCVEECLNIRELDGKMRVEKRMRELGKQGELQGGTHMAAVLLVTA